ncbi:thioredoxin domain-containing protein [Paenibacillus pinistramenti]|uniref:thioredoxin domain-containing protein n=1 Tax=Paenibacillus pinistramenti TaxID=1768003 RepID=UPI0011096AA3|nr:thioredoxin domain-containing protein [Paenibacillus pinistramenti]
MTISKKANRLANEKSPYLLQHAHNPVDWFPWSEDAFAKAKQENKPVFLSVGYSTCHWCHVMERESFENDEVAALLNKHYIAIKVDREERPDIDNLYMAVCQAMTGHGGWPLTVLLTPEKKPFYAGTYFPRRSILGRIGLMDMLEQIQARWDKNPGEMLAFSDELMAELEKRSRSSRPGSLDEDILHQTFQQFHSLYDPEFGGFGDAPKFPSPHNLSFLLAYSRQYRKIEAEAMVRTTLDAMHRGGLYDHIGFGFARYSTDERWLVPHFEKMLYDNALLAIAYLDGYQASGEQRFADVAEQVFAYVLRDMTSPEGAFYSAEDADSEGEEGKFYLFTRDEVAEALELDDLHTFCHVYDITPEGNFEGSNIPNLIQGTPEEIAQLKGLNPLGLRTRLEECRERLFQYREQRIHPHKDDKVLTAWNGLMIAALARGAKVLKQHTYAQAAARAANFIRERLRREDGRLLARYRDGESAYEAYIDDYAFLLWGLLELYEATSRAEYLQEAMDLKNQMFHLFWDEEQGGFRFSGHDAEQLLLSSKEIYDGALPSGNSVAALQLQKLAAITQDAELQGKVQQLLEAFAGQVKRYPAGHAMYMQAVLNAYSGGREIVLSGAADDPLLHEMIAEVQSQYLPGTAVLVHFAGEEGQPLRSLLPHVAGMKPVNGQAAAYICRHFACEAPLTSSEALREQLAK